MTLPTYNVGGAADKRRQFGKEEKKHTLGPDVGTRQSREEKQEDVELKNMACSVGFSRKDPRHGGTWSKFPPSHLYGAQSVCNRRRPPFPVGECVLYFSCIAALSPRGAAGDIVSRLGCAW